MRWEEQALEEMRQRIVQLGLRQCAVCASETMGVDRLPVIFHIGGDDHTRRNVPSDKDVNVLFMVKVECQMCGYAMLFNSERLLPGHVGSLVVPQ
jgi:hypothetical protein